MRKKFSEMHSEEKVRTDFHAALDAGNLDGVRKMTHDFPELIKQGWNLGGAIQNLVFAAQKGNLPLMQLLFKLGCDINAADERAGHVSPLSSAAYWGQESIVRWLLAEGVSVDGVCHAVSTPLIAAATRGHVKVIETLLDHGAEINREHLKCPVSCDHIPRRSWALFRARDVMRGVIESFKVEHAV